MLEDGSAVITDKMAQVLNLQPGDVMEIETDEGWRAVKVQDVAEHYLYHYAYLSPETYRQVYGEPVVYNQIYLERPTARTPPLSKTCAPRCWKRKTLRR